MPTATQPEKTDYRLRATREYKNYIDGEWTESSSGKTFDDINPADSGDVIGTFQESNADDLNRAVDAAHRAFQSWRLVPAPKRGEYLYAVGAVLVLHALVVFYEERTLETQFGDAYVEYKQSVPRWLPRLR